MLTPDIMINNVPDLVEDEDDEDSEPYTGENALEEGDHMLIATIPSKAEFIQAMSNVSQWLAEAFHELVPTHFHNFEDLFLKSSLDRLPDHTVWDHAIELIPGVKPVNCKVYLLAPNKQSKMDEFIQENLCSGLIHPSKSPMASPVFFIKKKDGFLYLVQDY